MGSERSAHRQSGAPDDPGGQIGLEQTLDLTCSLIRMLGQNLWLVAAVLTPLTVSGVEPNFEDLDLVVDQARDEKVDINQENPHSTTYMWRITTRRTVTSR